MKSYCQWIGTEEHRFANISEAKRSQEMNAGI
jgi:hypothetical protein